MTPEQASQTEYQTNHYRVIHQKVISVLWGDLPAYLKEAIAEDVQKTSRTYKEFINYVNNEVVRVYNDESFYYNNKYTFLAQ